MDKNPKDLILSGNAGTVWVNPMDVVLMRESDNPNEMIIGLSNGASIRVEGSPPEIMYQLGLRQRPPRENKAEQAPQTERKV